MKLRLTGLLAILFTLHGCAYLSSFSSDLDSKIDQLMREEQYGEALDILEFVSPKHVQYASLKKKQKIIEQRAADLVKQALIQAKVYEEQEKWQSALITYETALDKVPQDEKLNEKYEAFLARRNILLLQLEQALISNRAQWLIDNQPVQKEFTRILPEAERHYAELENFHQQIDDTTEKLIDCVEYNLEHEKYSVMQRCLRLVEELSPGKIDSKLKKQATLKINQTKRSKAKKSDKQTRALIAELKQGYSHDNLLRARKHLAGAKSKANLSRQSKKMYAELQRRYRAGIDQGIDAGRKLYSDGKINEALQVWNSLLEIDTTNLKLKEHIDRAERVINKLEKLSTDDSKVLPQKTR